MLGPNIIITDPQLNRLHLEKESSYDFRKRRHPDWRDNYTLYRGKVIPNRLTQRQTVNIPLMKYALNSILKDIDESPQLYFKNLDNNGQKEVYYNEYWKESAINRGKLVVKDILDKKQGILYGRTFKKLNIINGVFVPEVVDTQDILVNRFVDPADINSASCLTQINIYRKLSAILNNEDYEKEGRNMLASYYSEQSANLEQDETLNQMYEKTERMQDIGLEDALDPSVSETYVELNEFYSKEVVEGERGRTAIYLYTVAVPGGDMIILQKRMLKDIIGETVDDFWYDNHVFSSWGTDPERLDFWSDAPADSIRGANQILNSWFSQLVENRTLKNFNMNYYDSSTPDFVPQTWDPQPWGWYPTPGNPNEAIKTVPVADLSESIDEMKFVIDLAEKAVAATSAQTGDIEDKQVTLGEIQLALANAKERVQSTAVYYTDSWLDYGRKYIKLLEGAYEQLEPLEITKEGRLGRKMYKKTISPSDGMSKSGYKVDVKLMREKEEDDIATLQKLNAAIGAMPQNVPLRNIYNRRMLEFAGLTVEEREQVREFENQNIGQQMLTNTVVPNQQPQQAQAVV